jgi:hypothetical protein
MVCLIGGTAGYVRNYHSRRAGFLNDAFVAKRHKDLIQIGAFILPESKVSLKTFGKQIPNWFQNL